MKIILKETFNETFIDETFKSFMTSERKQQYEFQLLKLFISRIQPSDHTKHGLKDFLINKRHVYMGNSKIFYKYMGNLYIY